MNIVCELNKTKYCSNCIQGGNLNFFDVVDRVPQYLYNQRWVQRHEQWKNIITSRRDYEKMLSDISNELLMKNLDKFCLQYNTDIDYERTIGIKYNDFVNITGYVIAKMPNNKCIVQYLEKERKKNNEQDDMKILEEDDMKMLQEDDDMKLESLHNEIEYQYNFQFNKSTNIGKKIIKKCIFSFLDFIYNGNTIISRASFYQYNERRYKEMIVKGSALLHTYFMNDFLLNTKEKIAANQDYHIHQMLEVDKKRSIVFVDGIRFKIYKSGDFDGQYETYSIKDKYNAFNVIGIFTYSGKCIGFYPKTGNMSCYGNGDGDLWDRIIYQSQTGLVKLLPCNDPALEEDTGTIIFADKAWSRCFDRFFKTHSFYIPNVSNFKKPERQFEANEGRLCTMFRFSIEHSFIVFQQKWKFWRMGFNTRFLKYAASWVNICGALINFLEHGIKRISERREKELCFMKLRQSHVTEDTHKNLENILWYFKNPSSVTREKYRLTDGTTEYYWKKADTYWTIRSDPNNTYWNDNTIENFLTNSEDRRLMGGGPYGERNSKPYAYHSKHIQLYYSNHPAYANFLMIRNVIKKYSVTGPKPDGNMEKTHHVILGLRNGTEIIINRPVKCDFDEVKQEDIIKTFNYSWAVLNLKSLCTCRHGLRDISVCGHQTAAFYYVEEWLKQSYAFVNEVIIPNPKPESTKNVSILEQNKQFVEEMTKLPRENLEYSWKYWAMHNS